MSTTYDSDVIAWANEQASLLQAGRFSEIDIANVAEEILDVGKSEQRELASRVAVLLAHLLKWHTQPQRRSASWQVTIDAQRPAISKRLQRTPSLRRMLEDPEWIDDMWVDAVAQAEIESGVKIKFAACPWLMADVLRDDWLPPE